MTDNKLPVELEEMFFVTSLGQEGLYGYFSSTKEGAKQLGKRLSMKWGKAEIYSILLVKNSYQKIYEVVPTAEFIEADKK